MTSLIHGARGPRGAATARELRHGRIDAWGERVLALRERISAPFEGCLCWRIGRAMIWLLPSWKPPKQH
jgi:hypothetical protein